MGTKAFKNIYGREVEVFFILLLSTSKFSLLPELYEIFGKDATIKFLHIFSGVTFRVPSVEELDALAQNTKIYVRLESKGASQRAKIMQDLAGELCITVEAVRGIYKKTKAFLENTLGFSLVKKVK